MTEEEFKVFLGKKSEEILDTSVDKALEEMADKVAREGVEPVTDEIPAEHKLDVVETDGKEDGGEVSMEVEKNGGQQTASSAEGEVTAPDIHDDIDKSRISLKRAAAIPEVVNAPTRSSPRLGRSADEHSPAKA